MGMKIVSGNDIIVINGEDKGKIGKIIKIVKKKNTSCKVIVSGVNLRKKHVKQTGNKEGGILISERPIDISNVALLDPKNRIRTKVGFKMLNDKKVRFAKNSGEVIN